MPEWGNLDAGLVHLDGGERDGLQVLGEVGVGVGAALDVLGLEEYAKAMGL